MLHKLTKLKDKGFAEIYDRARQNLASLAERFGMSGQTSLPSDIEFFRLFDTGNEISSASDFLEYFRVRQNAGFYPSFDDPNATIHALRTHFPGEENQIIARADRICDGFFDLLGYKNLYFENKVPDWHRDPILHRVSPKIHWSRIALEDATQSGDKKIIWELNRHQYFSTLGRAYWLTRDEKYADAWIALLESWFAENPPKIGVNWLSSLELAFRSISWIWAFHFFKDSPKFSPEIFLLLLKYLYLHGRHIETYLSTYFSPNTHLTGEALALYFLASFLPELKDSSRWKNSGYRILLDSLDFQVRDDGVYAEQSSHYHRYTVDFYASLLILRRQAGEKIEPKHLEKLNGLLDFLLHITQPNGEIPMFGDDDGGRFYFLDEKAPADSSPTLALGAVLLGRGDLKTGSVKAGAELLWLLGADGLREFENLETLEPAETIKAFRPSGFFLIRDSWNADSNFLLIDCGKHGFLNGGHAHADALSIVMSVDGEPLLIDPGTHNYTSDLESRRLFRSTSSHNCLTVNGESSSIPDGPFSWISKTDAHLLEWENDTNAVRFRGTHSGFERFGVDYEREIIWEKGGPVTLIDQIKTAKTNSFEVNFILSPGFEAEIVNNCVRLFSHKTDTKPITITTKLEGGGEHGSGVWNIEQFEVSPRYGELVSSKKLVFSIRREGTFKICSSFNFGCV